MVFSDLKFRIYQIFFLPQENAVATPPPTKQQPEPVEPKPVQVPKVSTTAPKPEKAVEKAEKAVEEKKEVATAAPQIINNDKEATVTPAKTDVSAGMDKQLNTKPRLSN